ncbi:hypothetical protein ETI03_00075 [Macrococcoides canis]|uniref:hypothetical protein n=1 Tax=Macrococcoides canis TaxID=1855823 RepID=UPI00105E8CC7|nr:hypothetical protein [Macrococcus canis]TDM32126.1 hypothetical protein ETI03_00075 [Macrococcus canis]
MRYIKYIKGAVYPMVLTRIKDLLEKDDATIINDLTECIYYNEMQLYVSELIESKNFEEISQEQLTILKRILAKSINIFISNLTIEHIKYFFTDTGIYDFNDLLLLLKKYKKLYFVEGENLKQILLTGNLHYHYLLKSEWFVRKNLDIIKQELLKNADLVEILIEADFKDKYTESIKLLSFDNKYYCELVEHYIEKSSHLSNLLEVIYKKNGILFSLPAKVKLKAKKRYEEVIEEYFKQLPEMPLTYGVKIKQDDTIDVPLAYDYIKKDGYFLLIKWNKKMWDYNFDNLLNYFYYYSYFFNRYGILNISKKEKSTLAKLFKENISKCFNIDSIGSMYMMFDDSYTNLLEDMLSMQEKSILNLIEYFLNTVLVEEFGVNNFNYKIPETQNLYEKNRLLSTGLETLLKYYQYYVEYGYIDSEEILMGYQLKKIESLASQSNMYIALVNEDNQNQLMHLLFSNQSPLHIFYVGDKRTDNFFQLINNNNIGSDQFDGYDFYLDKLVDNGFIKITNGIIQVTEVIQLFLLQQLYYEEDINYYYLEENLRANADLLIEKGYVYRYGGLFSKQEQDIMSYLYSNERFDNAIGIRNKYAHPHTFQVNNDNESYRDYLLIIRLYMYIILKINDDCRIHKYINEKNS